MNAEAPDQEVVKTPSETLFDSIDEVIGVFKKHNIDLNDIACIAYGQEPREMRVSLIYVPGDQILAGIQISLDPFESNQDDELVEEAVLVLTDKGFGSVRVAPKQKELSAFLSLADLKPKLVSL